MKTLIEHIKNNKSSLISLSEKLVINKDYKYDLDFYNNFKEDIDSLFKDNFFNELDSIELCLYPKSRWSEGSRRDIIYTFNKWGNKKNPCYKGIAWEISSNPVKAEACKVWEKFIEYIKDNKDDLYAADDILICKEGFTCTYIINSDKALIFLDGNTDIHYSKFSDGHIVIQYK